MLKPLRRLDPWPVALLLLAFVLRIANLTGESLWRDEVDTVRFALAPLSEIAANFTATGVNGPPYHLLIRAWLALAGVSDFALRYFSLVCGVLLVALIYALGRRLFGRGAGLTAMALATASPILAWYAGEGKMYSLQPMLLTLALYALVRAATSGEGKVAGRRLPPSTPWWLTFIVATSLSFYVQLLSPLFLPVAAAFFLALWPQSRRHVAGGSIALAALTLPYLPLAVWQVPTLLRGGDIGHTFYPLNAIGLTLASNWALGLDGRAPLLNLPAADGAVVLVRMAVIALFVALVIYELVEGGRRARASDAERRRFQVALAAVVWLALPALLIYLISTRIPLFQPRYVLWSAPALYLLAGAGLARLSAEPGFGRWAAAVVGGALLLFSASGWLSQVINPIRPDLRAASRHVAAALQPGDALVFQIPYGRFGFEYYAMRAGRRLEDVRIVEADVFTNDGKTEDDIAATLLPALSGANRVWLYEAEAPMWDERGLVRSVLERDLIALERSDFRGVSVGLYEMP